MDAYTILGLQPGASEQDAKEAFRNLAKTCHPDLHPNDPQAEKRFKDINAAYDAIKNPPVNVTWQTFHTSSFSGGGTPFDEMFGNIFNQRRNADVVVDYRMTLDEAFYGKEVAMGIPINSPAPRNIKVSIPPGIAHGMRVRVPQGGHQTHPSMIPGDLYLMISVALHAQFVRQGHDLVTPVPVSVFDVLLCKDIEVVGIDGKTHKVSIPSGFDPRSKLRLSKLGMPDPYNGQRGDLLVDLLIQHPILTAEQRTSIQQIASNIH